jgi:hypothetical protein
MNVGAFSTVIAFFVFFLVGGCNLDDRVVDWYPYYKIERTEPYGLFVFNAEIERISPKFSKVERLKEGVARHYEQLMGDMLGRRRTYLYIDEMDKMNKKSKDALKQLAYDGHYVFISSHNVFNADFIDHFAFEFQNDLLSIDYENDTLYFLSAEQKILASSDKIRSLENFQITDTSWALPLGYYQVKGGKAFCNFMALRYGAGILFLHSNPEVFTNYFLLRDHNHCYTESLASFWGGGEIKWFVNYKQEYEDGYVMHSYLMEQPALKTAWYLLWILLVFAVFTYAKRTQRIIPVVLPKQNLSVDYVKRLAQFHLLQKNYKGLIDRQLLVLLDKLRNEYRMDTSLIDESFTERMRLITNCDKSAAEDIVRFINKQKLRSNASKSDFEELWQIMKKLNL